MKKLLAGLALAVGVALLFQKRRPEVPPEARPRPGGGEKLARPRGAVAGRMEYERQERVSSTGASAGSKAPGQEEAPKSQRARSAEEMLNSATRQQLLSVYGIGPVLADRIIQNRPYASAYDVVEQGIIPESIFVQLRKQLLDQPSA